MWSLSSVVGALPSRSICARQRGSVRRAERREIRAFVKRGGGGAGTMGVESYLCLVRYSIFPHIGRRRQFRRRQSRRRLRYGSHPVIRKDAPQTLGFPEARGTGLSSLAPPRPSEVTVTRCRIRDAAGSVDD